jgi:DNA repair protein RadC
MIDHTATIRLGQATSDFTILAGLLSACDLDNPARLTNALLRNMSLNSLLLDPERGFSVSDDFTHQMATILHSAQALRLRDPLTQHSQEQGDERILLGSYSAALRYLETLLGGINHEVFVALYLDAGLRLTAQTLLSIERDNYVPVDPTAIVATALRRASFRMIVAHNHPTGDPSPSSSDKMMTRELERMMQIFGIKLIDHIIIGNGRNYSFAAHGLLTGTSERPAGMPSEAPPAVLQARA